MNGRKAAERDQGSIREWTKVVTMPESDVVFERVTGGIRKPAMRFTLASGRRVELLALHLEPAWAYTGVEPRAAMGEVLRRLYPDEKPVVVTPPPREGAAAFLCMVHLISNTPAKEGAGNYSYLFACGTVERVDVGVRNLVCELLSGVNWEFDATDDFMW